MKANRNNHGARPNLISAVLIALSAITFSVLPVSVGSNGNGILSFSNQAFADDSGGKITTAKTNTIRPLAIRNSHASVNSVVGLLAIYKQKINDGYLFNKNKASRISILDNKIAALEMDLSNPHLKYEERKLIEKNLSAAEVELANTINNRKRHNGSGLASKGIAQKIRNLIWLDPGYENSEIDMMEAGGNPD
ncbi:MAG: hypothetical protein OEL50_05755 [Rhodospirillaceae bacterium]|nr:hypothetical protein [Rhodospirillaceae bacterium]